MLNAASKGLKRIEGGSAVVLTRWGGIVDMLEAIRLLYLPSKQWDATCNPSNFTQLLPTDVKVRIVPNPYRSKSSRPKTRLTNPLPLIIFTILTFCIFSHHHLHVVDRFPNRGQNLCDR